MANIYSTKKIFSNKNWCHLQGLNLTPLLPTPSFVGNSHSLDNFCPFVTGCPIVVFIFAPAFMLFVLITFCVNTYIKSNEFYTMGQNLFWNRIQNFMYLTTIWQVMSSCDQTTKQQILFSPIFSRIFLSIFNS